MSELIEQTSSSAIVSSESAAVLAMIERVVANPEADMDKLEKMLDLQQRILDRNAKQAFTADLAAMQAELPLVGKHGEGHNKAKYALLEDINEAIRPTLKRYGFAVTFRIKQQQGSATITAILSHRLGHSEETDLLLPLDTSGSKNAVQAVGSTVSYGKRYALCALLNISTGDDNDGNIPIQNSQKIAQAAKQPITDSRLAGAIAKIKSGEFTLEKLHRNFTLNEGQLRVLNEQVQQ